MTNLTNTLGPIPYATIIPGTKPNDIRAMVAHNLKPYTIKRAEAINSVLEDGTFIDELSAAMHYDFNHAPLTTNYDMLQSAGVMLVTPADIDATEASFPLHLSHLIHSLSAINVFLTNTNHLSDEELYKVLWTGPLQDRVRFLPPSEGVCEFIDLRYTTEDYGSPTVSNRDSSLPTNNSYPYTLED